MKTKHIIFPVLLLIMTSCATPNKSFYRGDVIGFNDKPITNYTKARGTFMNLKHQDAPCDLTRKTGKDSLIYEIESLQPGNNTTTYYAMELAAKRIKYVRKHYAHNSPATKYYIFLLTDGLDNASPQVAKEEKMCLFERTPEQYQNRVQRKLKSAMGLFHKNLFEVYPYVYKGHDLQKAQADNTKTKEEFDNYLKSEMSCFRYASHGEAPEVIVKEDLDDIAAALTEKFEQTTYTFRVPRSYAGKTIRMTLNNSQNQEIKFTAKVKKSLFTYTLTDIELLTPGVSFVGSKNTKPLKADKSRIKEDKVNAFFVLEDLRYGGYKYDLTGLKFTQEYNDAKHGIWQTNTEYVEVKENSIDTYFLVVIDGSYSLDGGQELYEKTIKSKKPTHLAREKKIATDMIDVLDVNKQSKKAAKKGTSPKTKKK